MFQIVPLIVRSENNFPFLDHMCKDLFVRRLAPQQPRFSNISHIILLGVSYFRFLQEIWSTDNDFNENALFYLAK